MIPPLNDLPDDPFERLRNRIYLRMKEEMIDEKMLGVAKDAYGAYTEVLRTENILLTQAERDRLFRAVLKEMLDEVLNDISA